MLWLLMSKIKFDPSSPIIIADVVIESKTAKRRLRMAIDSGSTHTMIPWEVAEALGYRPDIAEERTTLITASGVERAPLIKVDSIRIFGKEIRNAKVVVHDLPPRSYVDGLLGLRSLKELKARIDFDKGVIEV